MQSFCGGIRLLQRKGLTSLNVAQFNSSRSYFVSKCVENVADSSHKSLQSFRKLPFTSSLEMTKLGFGRENLILSNHCVRRSITTVGDSLQSASQDSSASVLDVPPPRIKFKRLDKTAKHIMQIVDKEAVDEVKTVREIPEIKPGYIVQLRVEVPENKRRVSVLKGIVIARRNAGLNTTFRLRRLVAGVGVESLFPLYSPNIKEIKVIDKKKVRRAKLYYLRDKMNALKKH